MRRIRLGTDLSLTTPERTVHLIRPLRPDKPGAAVPGGEPVWPGWSGTAEWFELTAIEDCDVAVLPFPWEDAIADVRLRGAAEAFCARADALGRAVFAFYLADDEVRMPIPNAIMFAHALHRSRKRPNEIAMPPFVPWPKSKVVPRPYGRRPSVGFCGKAWPFGIHHGSLSRRSSARLRYFAGSLLERSRLNEFLRSPVTFYHRAEAVQRLARDPRIESRFILRDVGPVEDPVSYRREYFENLEGSDYTLAVRGMGNFSLRLYEALAHGRIPLFVDTDCALPLASEIDWRSLCIWIDGRRIRKIADDFLAAHDAMDHEEFADRQRRCQDVWMMKLTEPGFFSILHGRLAGGIGTGGFIGPDGRRRLLRCLA